MKSKSIAVQPAIEARNNYRAWRSTRDRGELECPALIASGGKSSRSSARAWPSVLAAVARRSTSVEICVRFALMDRSDWFITTRERGNPASAIDRRHGGDAWTSNNLVTPLVHGRQYFARLHEVLKQTTAGDQVLFTDWRGDPDERLDGPGSEVVDVLVGLAKTGVDVKGLVWRSHPDATRFSEEENRTLAAAVNGAGGEVLLDERVRRAGSHHQKLFVVRHPNAPDTDVAFVGGIDLCHGRNDDEHHRGDPQAIRIDKRFGSTPAWHDIQVEIRGAAVGDIEETFRERWNDANPLHGAWMGRRRSRADAIAKSVEPLAVVPHFEQPIGRHAVQVLRTYPVKRPRYPFAPYGERSIARAYAKAFRRARRLIYIEDQYLWSADIARMLGRALESQPNLHVVVVVPRFPDEDGRLSGPPNRIGQLIALRRLRQLGGSRFVAYDLERDRLPVYVHAKICVIDDVWMTIGSDNLNRRSWTHDSELSCAVLDDTVDQREPTDPAGMGDYARVLPRETRLQLWREHLQTDDVPLDFEAGYELLRSSADAVERWHASDGVGPRPPGRLRVHDPAPVPNWQRPLTSLLYRFVNDPDGRPIKLRLRRSY
jgi:phosphatidylserine/phosphatidylglycerophosphate/cardiolipin synthase-like enzyme